MTLASSSMSTVERLGLSRLLAEHGMKLLRYCGMSVVNVVTGVGTLLVAAYHLQKGLRREFLDDIDTADLDPWQRVGLAGLGVSGFAARAVALGVVGALFLDAAIGRNPEEAAGLDDALRSLQDAPWGAALLTVTAVGLFCAGAYDMITFRRQRLD